MKRVLFGFAIAILHFSTLFAEPLDSLCERIGE